MSTNREAVDARDHRQALVTLLETLATQLDTTEAQIHAQLAAQYRAAWSELVALDAQAAPQEVSPLDRIVDELAPRREAGRGTAADHPRASGRRKPAAG